MNMKKLLRTAIGHGHNFATRCWVMTVAAVYWFNRLSMENMELQPVLTGLNKELFYLGLVCIAVILLAGTGRTFYPTDVKKIFDKSREKERIKQLLKMYLILFGFLFIVIQWRYFFPGVIKELFYLGLICAMLMLPFEVERSLRFRYIGNTYGKDPEKLERIWKKMMFVWHIVLLSGLAAGTYFQYTLVFK
ncbi:MAG: hypothetical protein HY754_09015 [Nitrospirae bacterium]|nr:hypothetical protein [Nitrospirota bacterium]